MKVSVKPTSVVSSRELTQSSTGVWFKIDKETGKRILQLFEGLNPDFYYVNLATGQIAWGRKFYDDNDLALKPINNGAIFEPK